jgi:hypothetical protein
LSRVRVYPVSPFRGVDQSEAAGRENPIPSVRVSALLKKGSLCLLFVCMLSVVSWAVEAVPIINPFLSMLAIFVSPFLYIMGREIEKDEAILK